MANILRNTGIDVRTADRVDQMEALAWEMRSGRSQFSDDRFRTMTDPAKAAAYFSQRFESPADGMTQAILRGQTALNLASSFQGFGASGGGGSSTVNIEKIEVNTQATDANQIAADIGSAIGSHLGMVAAQHDDGQKM